MRPRTVLYAAIIALVGGVMLYTLPTRDSEGVSVIHDRNPMFVRLSDGALRNAYTIRILNKQLRRARLHPSASTACRQRSIESSACRRAPTAASVDRRSAPTRRARCACW